MQRSQPFARITASSAATQPPVSNFAIYASAALFLLVFWLTVALVVL